MAILTKKDLLEAIEDMPIDAEVLIRVSDEYETYYYTPYINCDKSDNSITIC